MSLRSGIPLRIQRNPAREQQYAQALHTVHLRNLIRRHDVQTQRRAQIYHDSPLFIVDRPNESRNRYVQSYRVISHFQFLSVTDYIGYVRATYIRYVRYLFDNHGMFKLKLQINVNYINYARSDTPFHAVHEVSPVPIFTRPDIERIVDELLRELNRQAEEMVMVREGGSNLAFDSVINSFFEYARYEPAAGILRHGYEYIPLPKWISNKKACINPQNADEQCFLYCLELAYRSFHQMKLIKGERVHTWEQKNNFNFDGILCSLVDQTIFDACSLFERKNPGVNLNVFMPDGHSGRFEIIYKSKNEGNIPCDLLYFCDKKEEKWHYAFVKDFDRLLGRDGKKMKHCRNCLIGFYSQERLQQHQQDFECVKRDACTTILPSPRNAYYFFNNLKARVKRQNVIYADFECFIQKIHKPSNQQTGLFFQQHRPCSYGYRLVSEFPAYDNLMRLRRITKAEEMHDMYYISQQFIQEIQHLVNELKHQFITSCYWNVLGVNHGDFNNTTHCWLCGLPFHNGRKRRWVNRELEAYEIEKTYESKDGKFTHQLCFEAIRDCTYGPQEFEVPVVFHNLTNYDGHLILKSLDHTIKKITCIPQEGEAFLTFTLDHTSFIDSYRFMTSSLSKLSEVLLEDCKSDLLLQQNFKYSYRWFFEYCMGKGMQCTMEAFRKIVRKGIYPYEYMQQAECFDETELPSPNQFHSTLTGESITPEEYAFATDLWEEFAITDLGEWHDLYLAIDVNLLADVFENFRSMIYDDCGLDAVRYVSLPGLAKDMMLKSKPHRKQGEFVFPFEIDLIHCYQSDLYLLCDNAIRGGITLVPKRFAQAKKGNKIIDVDANNLYGWAMVQYLPDGNYKFLSRDVFGLFTPTFIQTLLPNANIGYFFTVRLRFPKHIHDKIKEYPLAPVKAKVSEDDISDYTKELLEATGAKHDSRSPKLMLTLNERTNYTVHYRLLQLYLSLGAEMVEIQNIMSFTQSPWMKDFVMDQTMKRKQATSKFKKDLRKFVNNSGYGKCVQDNTKFRTVKFATNDAEMLKNIRSPYYDKQDIINEECVMMAMRKGKVILDKPVAVGAAILELSKFHMYNFYYNVLKPVFKERVNLLMTDTDSLLLEVRTENFHADITKGNIMKEFDFSKYPPNHPHYNRDNDAILGKFKLEYTEDDIIEFVGLKPKCYSLLLKDGNQIKRAKGVSRETMQKRSMRHEAYKNCLHLETYEPNSEYMHGIRSRNQVLYTEEYKKKTLSPNDTKVYILKDGIHTLPYGHYAVPRAQKMEVDSEDKENHNSNLPK